MKEGRVKHAAFHLLRLSGLLALGERRPRGAAILAYHGVTADEPPRRGGLHNRRRMHVPRALFARQLELIAARWTPVALSRLVRCLSEGLPLPPRAVVLTFDDGYRNVLTQALPLLRAHGVPAAVFVVSGDGGRPFWQDRLEVALEATSRPVLAWRGARLPLGTTGARERAAARLMAALDPLDEREREDELARLIDALGGAGDCAGDERARLSWDEVRALRDAGLEIGSHADRHEPLTRRAAPDVAPALTQSRRVLERELGRAPDALSYPYGARSEAVARAAREAGFACALTGVPRATRPGADLFDLGRFLVGADDDPARLRASLSGLRGLWQRDPWPVRA